MNRQMIEKMKHSPIRNYVVPGLTSWLIGNPSPKGTIRLFECSRDQMEFITPHSHRFDFECEVLSGWVRNTTWTRCAGGRNRYMLSRLDYQGDQGRYEKKPLEVGYYTIDTAVYNKGDSYGMKASHIHSIEFGAGTSVLFYEGVTTRNHSEILEPYVDDEHVETFTVAPWMFQKS